MASQQQTQLQDMSTVSTLHTASGQRERANY